jgi:hypothetical protein
MKLSSNFRSLLDFSIRLERHRLDTHSLLLVAFLNPNVNRRGFALQLGDGFTIGVINGVPRLWLQLFQSTRFGHFICLSHHGLELHCRSFHVGIPATFGS